MPRFPLKTKVSPPAVLLVVASALLSSISPSFVRAEADSDSAVAVFRDGLAVLRSTQQGQDQYFATSDGVWRRTEHHEADEMDRLWGRPGQVVEDIVVQGDRIVLIAAGRLVAGPLEDPGAWREVPATALQPAPVGDWHRVRALAGRFVATRPDGCSASADGSAWSPVATGDYAVQAVGGDSERLWCLAQQKRTQARHLGRSHDLKTWEWTPPLPENFTPTGDGVTLLLNTAVIAGTARSGDGKPAPALLAYRWPSAGEKDPPHWRLLVSAAAAGEGRIDLAETAGTAWARLPNGDVAASVDGFEWLRLAVAPLGAARGRFVQAHARGDFALLADGARYLTFFEEQVDHAGRGGAPAIAWSSPPASPAADAPPPDSGLDVLVAMKREAEAGAKQVTRHLAAHPAAAAPTAAPAAAPTKPAGPGYAGSKLEAYLNQTDDPEADYQAGLESERSNLPAGRRNAEDAYLRAALADHLPAMLGLVRVLNARLQWREIPAAEVPAAEQDIVRWVNRAADLGHGEALRVRAGWHHRGQAGFARSTLNAMQDLEKAAAAGDWPAMRMLAEAAHAGEWGAGDPQAAEKWLVKAQAAGDPEAGRLLTELKKRNLAKAASPKPGASAKPADRTPVPVGDVPRAAFTAFDRLAKMGHLRTNDTSLANREKLILEALAVPDWKSASKLAFIDELVRPDFRIEVSPRVRPGFAPPKFVFAGNLTETMRQRVLALKPELFRPDATAADWLRQGYEGWAAILRQAVDPARRPALAEEIARHLRPVARRSSPENSYQPLRTAMQELHGRSAAFAEAPGDSPTRARVLSHFLLREAGRRLTAQTTPPLPAFVYEQVYAIHDASRHHLENPAPLP